MIVKPHEAKSLKCCSPAMMLDTCIGPKCMAWTIYKGQFKDPNSPDIKNAPKGRNGKIILPLEKKLGYCGHVGYDK